MTDIKENTSWQGESRSYRWMSIHGWRVYWYYAYTNIFSNRNDYYKYVIITDQWYKEVEQNSIWQFTWLIDKNWVEIYEGDIVSSNLWLLKWDVYYRQEWLYEIRRAWWLFEYDMWRFEVIWNIYQNKDLLSEK